MGKSKKNAKALMMRGFVSREAPWGPKKKGEKRKGCKKKLGGLTNIISQKKEKKKCHERGQKDGGGKASRQTKRKETEDEKEKVVFEDGGGEVLKGWRTGLTENKRVEEEEPGIGK